MKYRETMALSGRGLAAAGIIWIVLLGFISGEAACLGASFCDRGDFWLFGIIGGGMLVPAYFSVVFLGMFFKSLMDAGEDR